MCTDNIDKLISDRNKHQTDNNAASGCSSRKLSYLPSVRIATAAE